MAIRVSSEETGLYYLNARYYDPEVRRFFSADDISVLECTHDILAGSNLYSYCFNDPINTIDADGDMPNWLKWLIGGIAFTGAVILTTLTAGSLAPVFISMGISIIVGGMVQGGINLMKGDSFWKGFADGMADGAFGGGIFALAGSIVRIAKNSKTGYHNW